MSLFDPSRVPGPVRDSLAVIGFWACPPDVRARVAHWDGLHQADAAAAARDLKLLGSALARPGQGQPELAAEAARLPARLPGVAGRLRCG